MSGVVAGNANIYPNHNVEGLSTTAAGKPRPTATPFLRLTFVLEPISFFT
jgi:hypothetical protein